MDDTVINFDQLQDEINEAERYLREEVLRTKTQGYGRSFRSSKEKSSVSSSESQLRSGRRNDATPSVSAVTTPKKYANPESREKLLNRLMSEHGSKQSTPGSSRSSTTPQTDMLGNGSNTFFNPEDYYGSSRISSPALSRSSTPHHDANSNDSFGGYNETGDIDGDDNYFLRTVKKYSDNNVDDPQVEETLFFASDVISPSSPPPHQDNTPPVTDSSHHMLTHRDIGGKLLSTLYAGDHEADYLASHVILPSSSPSQEGRSSSLGRSDRANTNRVPAATSMSHHTDHKATNVKNDTRATEGSQKKHLKSKQEVIDEAEHNFKHQHTFKPKIELSKNKKKIGSGQESAVDRIDTMIQVHGQSLANRERQKIELERSKLEQNCSFKPQLSKGTQQIMRQKAKEFGTEQYQQKDAGGHDDAAVSASERLYRQAGKHQIQQRMLKHQLDEAQNSECTFQPAVNTKSTSMVGEYVEQRPLYERVGDVQRQQAMSRQVLLECYEEADNEQITLNPEINDKSRRMVDKSRHLDDPDEQSNPLNPNDVGSRLMNEARNQLNRKYRLIEEREKELASNVKNPALCRGSQRYVTNNPKISESSFIKRQDDHAKKVNINISKSRTRDEVESNKWFKPDISTKTNAILSENRPEVIEETPEQRALRLYRDDAEDIERKRRDIEQEMYGNISFVPTIDPISKELGRSTGVKELSENKRGRRLKMKSKQTFEQRESEECTFQPQIAQSQKSYLKELYSSGKVHSGPNLFAPHMAWDDMGCPLHRDSDQRSSDAGTPAGSINLREPERMARDIRLHQLEKDEKRRAELIVREIDELQECSFQPKIYRKPASQSSRPVTVAGVGRHFELKYMKQKQDEESRQREQDAFRVKNVETFRRKVDGSTVVEPFQMAQSSNRKSRAAAELEECENSNLTFHPVTNDFERRLAAKRVMEKTSFTN